MKEGTNKLMRQIKIGLKMIETDKEIKFSPNEQDECARGRYRKTEEEKDRERRELTHHSRYDPV